jgi:predicted nuclease with TOPRIM domain
MDQTTYDNWWRLHTRLARGGDLSAEEQGIYDAGRRDLERDEQFQEAVDARRVRLELRRLEQEHVQLENQRRQLEAELAQLESRLSEPTRQFLNVGD